MRKIYLILALLIGCGSINKEIEQPFNYTDKAWYVGSAKNIPIWIDNDFSINDKEVIEGAISFWNKALNGHIKLIVVDDKFNMSINRIKLQEKQSGWLIMKISSDSFLTPYSEINYRALGFTDMIGGSHLYLVRDKMKDEYLFGVVLHEIGHLLGSVHVGEGLMSAHFDFIRFRCIDYDTIKAVAAYNDLDINNLNYCQNIK